MALRAFQTRSPSGDIAIFFGDAAPATGDFRAGDVIVYEGSSSEKPYGWRCTAVTSGVPTWESIGASSVHRVYFNVPAGAAAGDYDGVLPVPAGKLIRFVERHKTAGSDGSAVTLMLKKVPSGTAQSAGTDMLSAGVSLKATADTNQSGALHATAANLATADGDGVALVTTGTLTGVDGVSARADFLLTL